MPPRPGAPHPGPASTERREPGVGLRLPGRVPLRVGRDLHGLGGCAELHGLPPGDVEEALTAATAIGDDRLQRQSRGMVVPDSFTHGTSEQRVRWFKIGLASGQIADCDTFGARAL